MSPRTKATATLHKGARFSSVPRCVFRRVSSNAAFTLIELLVAISVSVVLAGLLVVVTRGALDLWQRAQDRSTASVQAKTALGLLVSDFQSVLYRAEGEPTIALNLVNAANLGAHNWRTREPLLKPDTVALFTAAEPPDPLGRTHMERSGAWLRLISFNHGPEGTRPQAISYQIARRPVSGSVNASPAPPIRYTLFRHFATPELTFASGYDITHYDSHLARPALDQALCDNVVDFGLWFYRRESGGALTLLYPKNSGDRDFLARGGGAGRFPDVVDIMLRVVSESGAARLEQMELGQVVRPPEYTSDDEWWWAVVQAESRVYAERVSLSRPRGL
ncbi:hypothetical protein AXK11_04915 [Cephaloticoccus primus]|uniref:Prepilin-type N-terminal cleavage/methylation domain-containing protein n=1 Tax=Cephaloticoccus primus TaxID=1548207 RepID=A0A139SMY6_9BACT|nr:prepilin-type N-terminal cleavage/methylation domain-containing protein [Cephaloticoccus primus]KXU35879.1 hypothetical protein AXK11_04915 [Cephaloticoccus primus]